MITFDMAVEAKYYVLTDGDALKVFEKHFEKEEVDELYKILQNNEDPAAQSLLTLSNISLNKFS